MINSNVIHVGLLIRIELFRQQRNVKWLSEQLGIQRTNCYRILNAPSIHTNLLIRISIVMRHDFFAECSTIFQSQILKEKI